MDDPIEYLFGTGDGATTSWVSAPDTDVDHDGRLDAVTLDFDGDGRRDDAMWDTDADGIADTVALDRDDDGRPDDFYGDDGSGVWGEPAARSEPDRNDPDRDEPPPRPGRVVDPAPPPEPPQPPEAADTIVVASDLDGDGTDDIELVGTRRGGVPVAERLYVDSDGDGRFDRVLVDSDGDGRADVSFDARSPRFEGR
ncbi:hypothetical protein VZC37_16450 [Gordonia sp. LSe1-13]|uniref:Pullulanase n=1 Tax=Gordonia sesuvii TaxID=3116777 RepID=A0ABU7MFP4_9ACTN|nr:hypothetical protein [Gordonia sp. LSe1-13]